MPILPIGQIITERIEILGRTSPIEIPLMPTFTAPLVGNIGDTENFVAHSKIERLSFLTLKLESVGVIGQHAFIDVKLVVFHSEESPDEIEFDLISHSGISPIVLSGTIFMKSDFFYVKTVDDYVLLRIFFSENLAGVRGRGNFGVEMLWDRMSTGI